MSDAATRIDALAKMLDHQLSSRFRDVLADHSTTTDEFTMLSLLVRADGPLPWDALEDRMPGVRSAGVATQAWEGLAAAGWVAGDEGLRVATDSGKAAYAELHGEIARLHDDAVAGVSDDDYATAVAVLTHMLGNLER